MRMYSKILQTILLTLVLILVVVLTTKIAKYVNFVFLPFIR